ncbi:transmembrane protein, putative [Medicago truncatula]|uniref:Transmembrane protein, putative n=1 Tax=Medicago truncatula TaxID=3880 RepID=G7IF17_MEDTR|nr:transmembrane protein, putative [Medicago truncatula]
MRKIGSNLITNLLGLITNLFKCKFVSSFLSYWVGLSRAGVFDFYFIGRLFLSLISKGIRLWCCTAFWVSGLHGGGYSLHFWESRSLCVAVIVVEFIFQDSVWCVFANYVAYCEGEAVGEWYSSSSVLMNVQSLYVKLFDMPCCNGRFAFMQGDDHVNTDSIPYAQVQPSSYTLKSFVETGPQFAENARQEQKDCPQPYDWLS